MMITKIVESMYVKWMSVYFIAYINTYIYLKIISNYLKKNKKKLLEGEMKKKQLQKMQIQNNISVFFNKT